MATYWCLTLLEESLPCHAMEQFPVIVGSGTSCDIHLDDPEVASAHLQINGDDRRLQVLNISGNLPMAVNGKQTRHSLLKRTNEITHVVVGNSHLLLSYGPPNANTVRELLESTGVAGATQWFYSSNDSTIGPLTENDLIAAADGGALQPHDLVWRADDPQPIVARLIEGLFQNQPAPNNLPTPKPAGGCSRHAPSITCPSCWHRFPADAILFIAGHPDLIGDNVLGADEMQRFLPSRFTPDGLAIDAGGLPCPDMACPRCHIRLPAHLLSAKPLIISIVGAPASGKSYFLASTTWSLRSTLPRLFGFQFTDVDASTNQWLNDYEEKLFLQTDQVGLQEIVKTDSRAKHVYKTITLNGMPVVLPLPCMFTLRDAHKADNGHCLILYDNAGEHFQAGRDTAGEPGTQHLAYAEGVVFFYDPSADPRFAPFLNDAARTKLNSIRAHRQDVLLIETITRIQRRLGLRSTARYTKPFVVVLSKADLFGHLLDIAKPPWLRLSDGTHALDRDRMADYSFWCRAMLLQVAPELVNTVESFAEDVIYMPASALGHAPGQGGVRPSDVHPQWVEAPILRILAHLQLVPVGRNGDSDAPLADIIECHDRMFVLKIPGSDNPLEVPKNYSGSVLTCPYTGLRFRVPDKATGAKFQEARDEL